MSGFRAAPNAGAQAGSAPPASTLSQPYWRDVHSKTHGCIKATFTVLDNLDSRFRYGLFANPGQHHAWIRFSSGNEYPQPDSTHDARGIAIKVMGVPGRKLLEDDGLPPAATQDFPLMNATQFFIRDKPNMPNLRNTLAADSAREPSMGIFWAASRRMCANGTCAR
jgi:catalase